MASIDYSKLISGTEVSSRTIVLDEDSIAGYVDAVGDANGCLVGEAGTRLTPPMALAALTLGGVINDLQIPGGTVHAGQEIEFNEAVPLGETIECKATVVQNSVRGGMRFMVVRLMVENGDGRKVMEGKSTIMLPTH
jgi:acyl dehydratase